MLSRQMGKVVIVGAGLTGAVTASSLRQNAGNKVDIEVFDKSRGTGGRMGTSRSPKDPSCTVDLGAQYISATPDYYSKHEQYYTDLLSNNVFKPLDKSVENMREQTVGTKHFTAPDGVGSIVKHFVKKAEPTLHLGKRVESINLKDKQWHYTTEDGECQQTDCLVLTMPVTQILQLKGDISNIIESQPALHSKLSGVSYSSRFALGLFYRPGTEISVPWAAKYFKNDDCIVFVSVDNKKRGKEGADVSPSVAVHTNVPFGLKHLEEDMKTVCESMVLPRLRELVPELPEPAEIKPHKWRYSQVHKPYEGSPGAIVLHADPLLICAGDGFVHSNFDACIESAETVIKLLGKHAKL